VRCVLCTMWLMAAQKAANVCLLVPAAPAPAAAGFCFSRLQQPAAGALCEGAITCA
jgi:hypothetical protein